jgi:hypothetical protein
MSFLCGVTDGSEASVSVVNHCEDSELSGQLRIRISSALNLGFSEWRSFLKNDHLTAALIDRLTENSHVINMKNCISLRPKLAADS